MPRRRRRPSGWYTIKGHKLESWFGEPASLRFQGDGYTWGCRCKHCTARRNYIRALNSARWPANAAEALRRNRIVLDAIVEDLGA